MSTLYIHLPCKTAADLAPHWLNLACRHVLVNDKGAIEREAVTTLTDLSAAIAKAQRVFLLLAASDVTLLQVVIPPLSAAKLKAALPNLVEDQLLGNPADCVVIAGDVSNGLRTIAVVQRAWLERIAKAMLAFGARHISMLAAQLCLPHHAGRITAAITQHGNEADLTLRLSEQTGMGLALSAQQPEEVIQSLCAIISEASITLYAPPANLQSYQKTLSNMGLTGRISITTEAWPLWISGASSSTLNLMSGLHEASGSKINWQPWRGPLILAATIVLVNIAALNFDWWQMKSEAKNLRSTLTQIYQSRYPNESVIIDPIAQMRQKISFAKRDSGVSAPDDFTALAASFGEAWNVITAPDKPAITKLEYREHALLVSLKPSSHNPDANLMQQIKAALANRNLSLTVEPVQSDTVTWKIRSAP